MYSTLLYCKAGILVENMWNEDKRTEELDGIGARQKGNVNNCEIVKQMATKYELQEFSHTLKVGSSGKVGRS